MLPLMHLHIQYSSSSKYSFINNLAAQEPDSECAAK